MLTDSTGFAIWISDESGCTAGVRLVTPVFGCVFSERSLSWLHPVRGVPCGFYNISGTISTHFISSPNVVGAGAAASSLICSLTTAGLAQLECTVPLTSFTEVVIWGFPSWMCQFVKFYLLQPKSIHVLLYCFGDRAHHPAWFIIFMQLALLFLFIILILPILPSVGTCKIAQTVSDNNHHLMKRLFWLSGCVSRVFSCYSNFLPLLNCCLWVFNLLSCPCGFSRNTNFDPFHTLYIAEEM